MCLAPTRDFPNCESCADLEVTYFCAPNGVRSLRDRAAWRAEKALGARPILRILPGRPPDFRNTDVVRALIYTTTVRQRLARARNNGICLAHPDTFSRVRDTNGIEGWGAGRF
jgi:hypothetical protein